MPSDTVNTTNIFKGKFRQGDTVDFILKLFDVDGTPVDPTYISCTISNVNDPSDIDIVETATPYKINIGFYVYEWVIPDTQAEGRYSCTWDYTLTDGTFSETHYFVISEDATEPNVYNWRVSAFREALEYNISCAQHIPVYFEQARPTPDRKTYNFSFPNWNPSIGVKIYKNRQIVEDGYSIDYEKGVVVFEEDLLAQETINADYNFRWFTDDNIDRYTFNAVQTLNMYPPQSTYELLTVPDRYIPIILYGAAKDAIRQLLMCLQFQQPQMVFGGPEAAQKAFSNLETLKKNYESDWEKLLEQKKFGPYPRSALLITPEYTLPGGRSRWFRYLFKG